MKLYVLDTSVCGFVQNEYPKVMSHAGRVLVEGDQMVTRNIVDFERVPGLQIEDWTK